jgi:hypothetical protein
MKYRDATFVELLHIVNLDDGQLGLHYVAKGF